MRQLEFVDRIAADRRLDRAAGAVRDLVQRVVRPGTVKDLLHGVWLGHPLHPALAQFAVGCWTGAAVLDATGDDSRAAGKLIRWGLLSSLPTAAAGLADYADGHEEQQRIGVVHALCNSSALVTYLVALRLRATGHRTGGAMAALAAYGAVLAGATQGGDLAFRRAMGANHAAEVPHTGPEEWTDLGAVDEFAEDEPARRAAGLIHVVVLRSGDRFDVLHDRCAHMAAPLHQGELVEVDGERCLRCPWHGSVFRASDGAVLHGPSTAPQPALDTRVRDGRLEAKVHPIPGVSAS